MARLIFSPSYRTYDFGAEHPFSPLRLDMALDLLAALGHDVTWTEPPPAGRADLLTVHTPAFVDAVAAASVRGGVGAEAFGLGTADTPLFPGIDEAARAIVGGTLFAASLVADGTERRVLQFGGGLHHAQPAHAAGFCVYNDLAVAIRHLTARGMWVSYLDLDVHHGDGVQAVFFRDDKVQTISIHESGQYLFPGTGAVHELGEGLGRGLKLNVPLEPYTDADSYLDAFERVVPPALEAFGPHVLVVQAGADAHYDDPLADLALTTQAYERLFRRVLALADECTGGRVVFTLGGGYSLLSAARIWAMLWLVVNDHPVPEGIPAAWWATWKDHLGGTVLPAFHDPVPAFAPLERRDEIARRNVVVANRLLEALAPYWY